MDAGAIFPTMSQMDAARAADMDWTALPVPDAARTAEDEAKVRRGFWKKLRRTAAGIPFAQDATAAYYAALDRRTPLKVRATLLAALAYFVLPTDAVPDIFPMLGFTDDAAVLMTALRLISSEVNPQHHAAAREAIEKLRTQED